jgi:hypothetical protein
MEGIIEAIAIDEHGKGTTAYQTQRVSRQFRYNHLRGKVQFPVS